MDYGWFKVRKHIPVLYGVDEAGGGESGKNIGEINDMISFVISGEYEWYNKNRYNVLNSTYNTGILTMYSLLPSDSSDQHLFSDENPLRWFTKTLGWKMK